MRHLEVEVDAPEELAPCKCCGKSKTLLQSAVYDGDESFAVVGTLISRHYTDEDPVLFVTLNDPAGETKFTLRARRKGDGRVGFGFVDDDDDPEFHAIPSEAAWEHPRKQDVFDAIHAVVHADANLRRHFERPGFDA